MRRNSFQSFIFLMVIPILAFGCATTRAKRPDATADLQSQVTQLQNEVQAKDQQIEELQSQLESSRRALQPGAVYPGPSFPKSSVIRVSGVTATDVQNALLKTGIDPGPVDGRVGKKTKTAIKEFQRRHNLTADGIVGERTWALLK